MNHDLTQREREAVSLAASGATNREVGREMGIEQTAVAQYLHRAYGKLGVSGRRELLPQVQESLK